MSDLAENIRLYGGSRVLEMIQSLDSPVWKTQVCWFSAISLCILRAALLLWATYCAWHIFQKVPVPLVFIVFRNLLRGPIFYRLWLTGNTKKHCDKPPKSKAKYAASRVWGTASIWERISASVDSRESRWFGTETPTGSKGGHWALPHASLAPQMLLECFSCLWVAIELFHMLP